MSVAPIVVLLWRRDEVLRCVSGGRRDVLCNEYVCIPSRTQSLFKEKRKKIDSKKKKKKESVASKQLPRFRGEEKKKKNERKNARS